MGADGADGVDGTDGMDGTEGAPVGAFTSTFGADGVPVLGAEVPVPDGTLGGWTGGSEGALGVLAPAVPGMSTRGVPVAEDPPDPLLAAPPWAPAPPWPPDELRCEGSLPRAVAEPPPEPESELVAPAAPVWEVRCAGA